MPRFAFSALALLTLTAVAGACELCGSTCPAPNFTSPATPTPAESGTPAETALQKKHRELAEAVWAKLLKTVKVVPGENWPANLGTEIVFAVVEKTTDGQKYNAIAFRRWDKKAEGWEKKDGKYVPRVRITYGYIALCEADEDAVALVLAHELGHHALGHTVRGTGLKPGALADADGHRREADADLYGARLMLKAGYSLREGVKAEWRGLDSLGAVYSAAEGTCLSHPATSDRAARLMKMLDKGELSLWQHMAAFENGVAFLQVHNYAAAEQFFLRVVQEFPTCHEAWANLGLARLMRYCQGLSAEEMSKLGVGHFLHGTHYRTARSLVTRTGPNEEMWAAAVAALKKANELKPGEPLVLTNLGLAHLLNPRGKDVGAARECFDAAERAFERADDLTRGTRLTLLINFGVAALAEGKVDEGQAFLDRAKKLAGRLFGDRKKWPAAIRGAIAFNAAESRRDSDEAQAAALYAEYLAVAPRSSAWWPTAYERYKSLCKRLNRTPVAKDQFARPKPLARQLLVELPGVGIIHVGQDIDEALAKLGPPTRETKERQQSSVRRLTFAKHGIELLADSDEVFAIVITSPESPAIEIRDAGIRGKKLGALKVGMTRNEVAAMIGKGEDYPLFFFTKEYAYYTDLAVAVDYDEKGAVTALIIGQVSRPEKAD